MITTKLIFDRRKQASRTIAASVEIRITIDRHSYYISTGVRVCRGEWVAAAVANRPDAEELNKRIRIIYNRVMAEINAHMESGEALNLAELRLKVWIAAETTNGQALIDWITEQLDIMQLADGTMKHYRTLRDRLIDFGCIKSWHDLTVENIYRFDAWLHQLPDQKHRGTISDAAVYNYHKCFKALINRAYEMGRVTENPYHRMKGRIKRGEKENIEYLTDEEMERIQNLQLPEGSMLDIARDLFTFQMYTGLAYSDAMAFNPQMYKNEGGKWKFTGDRIKTGVPYVGQLLPPVVKVLKKYKWQLPRLDNADYNKTLKLIGEAAGITTRMHTHLARHTFATMMLRNGAKFENVGKMLGQKNLRQTQRYAKVLAQSVHDDYSAIERRLKSRRKHD